MATVSNKFALSGSYATIIVLASVMLWMFGSLIYPFTVITNREGSFTVQNKNKEVFRGSALQMRLNYCKQHVGEIELNSSLEAGGQIFALPQQEFPSGEGCFDTVLLEMIPATLPIETTSLASTGRAKMRWSLKFKINSLRTINQTFVTDEFTIVR